MNGAIKFKMRNNVALFVFMLTGNEISKTMKYFFMNIHQSFHFMQDFKIPQLEKVVPERIPQEKEK